MPGGGIAPASRPFMKLVGAKLVAGPVWGAIGLIGIAGVPETGTPPIPDVPGLSIPGGDK